MVFSAIPRFPPKDTQLGNGANYMYVVWTPQEPALRTETLYHKLRKAE